MTSKEKNTNLFTLALLPIGVGAVVWAIKGLPVDKVDPGVITLALLTVFCSCYLRVQLPRLNIHLTLSDALIMIAMLLYGGEISVLLAVVPTGLASFSLLRQGVTIKKRTILVNVLIAAIAVFAAAQAITRIFGPTDLILQRGDFTSFVWMLAVMAATLFLVNSILISVYAAVRER